MKETFHGIIIPLILMFIFCACGQGLKYTPSSTSTTNQGTNQGARSGGSQTPTDERSRIQQELDKQQAEQKTPENPATPPPNQGPSQAEIQAQMLAQGTAAYDMKCANCHMPLANTAKPNRTANQILQSANIMPHMGVQWPNQAEADLIALALSR